MKNPSFEEILNQAIVDMEKHVTSTYKYYEDYKRLQNDIGRIRMEMLAKEWEKKNGR